MVRTKQTAHLHEKEGTKKNITTAGSFFLPVKVLGRVSTHIHKDIELNPNIKLFSVFFSYSPVHNTYRLAKIQTDLSSEIVIHFLLAMFRLCRVSNYN